MKNKLGSIEFFRIFLTVCVIWGHYAPDWLSETLLGSSNIFFIIAGYFLYFGAQKAAKDKSTIWGYAKKRYVRIMPPALFVIALALCFGMMDWGHLPAYLTMSANIWIGSKDVTPMWYPFALFWAQIAAILVLVHFPKKISLWMLAIVGALAGTALITAGMLHKPFTLMFGLVRSGFLRGVFGLVIGVMVAKATEVWRIPENTNRRQVFGAAELALFAVFIVLYVGGFGRSNQPVLLGIMLIFAVLLFLLVQSAGAISQRLNKIGTLAKISVYAYPVFILQGVAFYPMRRMVESFSDWLRMITVLAAPIALGVFYVHCVAPVFRYFRVKCESIGLFEKILAFVKKCFLRQ